jgi:hypothetical protein
MATRLADSLLFSPAVGGGRRSPLMPFRGG